MRIVRPKQEAARDIEIGGVNEPAILGDQPLTDRAIPRRVYWYQGIAGSS